MDFDLGNMTSGGAANDALARELMKILSNQDWSERLATIEDLATKTTPSQRTEPTFVQANNTFLAGDTDLFAPGGFMDTLVPPAGIRIADSQNDQQNPSTRAMLQGLLVYGLTSRIHCVAHNQTTGVPATGEWLSEVKQYIADTVGIQVLPGSDNSNPVLAPINFNAAVGNTLPILPFTWLDNAANVSLVRTRLRGTGAGLQYSLNVPGTAFEFYRINVSLAVQLKTLAFDTATRKWGAYGLTMDATGKTVLRLTPGQ